MTDPTVIKRTRSVCSVCLARVPAEVVEEAGRVVLRKRCPEHGAQEALLASDPAFYFRATGPSPGCGPGGCGPFNHSCTLMFEITDHCNLTCPTCFAASAPELSWRMSLARFRETLDRLLDAGKRDSDVIQFSGGEPTLHPELLDMMDYALERGVTKLYLNTNGLRLGTDPDFAAQLGRYRGHLSVYLQLDGLRRDTFQAIRGAPGLLPIKERAVERAHAAGVYVLPVMTVTPGVNLDEVGDLIRWCWARHPHVRSLVLQPAMYAGRYAGPHPPQRLTVGELVGEVAAQSHGLFEPEDFGPIPCSDPNCFSLAVGLRLGERLVPVSRYMPRYERWTVPDVADRVARFAERLPQHMLDALLDDPRVDDLVADGPLVDQLLDLLESDDETALHTQSERFFVVAIKPFMDAHTYDQDRVDRCCVHVVDRSGAPVSLCEYNTLRRPQGLL